MNLYGRLAAVVLKGTLSRTSNFFETISLPFRVLPQDCDMNMHLTNSRYFAFCDIARLYSFMKFGILFSCAKKGWFPVVDAQEIRFIKSIRPLERFKVETTFLGWDDKYLYFQQEFINKSKISAVVHVRGGLIGKEGVVSPRLFSETLLDGVGSPELPEYLQNWDKIMCLVKQEAIRKAS